MGKTKDKTSGGNLLPENKLLKAMAELEAVVKGDALEEQDPEGGLSTEGTPLSDAAPSGRGETRKSRRSGSSSSSSSSSNDASSVEKAEGGSSSSSSSSDAASDGGSMPPRKKKGVKKAVPPPREESSDDSTSDDESSDDDASTEKSFREAAEGDEKMAKAIEVSDFIEAMVDQISASMTRMQRDFQKSLQRIEERLSARIDNRVAKSMASQQDFNARLAKAIATIGSVVQDDLVDMVKSLANSPAAPRGKAVLSKGEVNQPPWGGSNAGANMADGSEGGDDVAALRELSPEKIGDWMFKKAANNQLDPKTIMAWEADRYNVEALPDQVRKALANDLCK